MTSRRLLRDYGIAVVLAVGVAVSIRVFLLEAYRIPTPAMLPTLEPGDTIFVGKTPLLAPETPQRGDVVLFSPAVDPPRDYIKRVLAVSGDRVSIRGGRVFFNGAEAALELARSGGCGSEKLVNSASHGVCFEPPPLEDYDEVSVPVGKVFILGDLRTRNIIDTRKDITWGLIPISIIKGKALWIWLSVEPRSPGGSSWFPQFRFERMFRRIE